MMNNNNLDERIDDLQIKGYRLIQNKKLFCFGIDAVLLASFAEVKKGENALDLGCGNGVIPILLEAKNQGNKYCGLELQHAGVNLAKRNVSLNGLNDKIEITQGDIKEAAIIYGSTSFSVVTTNPPYMIGDHGPQNDSDAMRIARHEVACTIDDILKEAYKLLLSKGRFYMVHRPFRLPELFAKMSQNRIEPKRMRLVHPYRDKEPNLVLIEGVKDAKSRLKVEPPFIVYHRDGGYTDEVKAIYE